MRIIQYKTDAFNTDDAAILCAELEASLGVSLHVTDPAHPNLQYGALYTHSDGIIEIHLYEQEDCLAMDSIPEEVYFAKCDSCGCEQNEWTDPDLCENCGNKIDYSKGKLRALKAHDGIYQSTNKTDNQIAAACDNVLISKYKMMRAEEMGTAKCLYVKSVAVEANERALAKVNI